jgi:predicted dehydrogenase
VKNILIFGAGSIGNHMSYACRKNGLDVYVTDSKLAALKRMKNEIYPKRYGSWDDKIKLINIEKLNKIDKLFDLVIIGTPPNTHIKIYDYCKRKVKYKKILIEKPISNYLEKNLHLFQNKIKNDMVFCGYNHSISPSFKFFMNKFKKIKDIKKIKINWCESWEGILKAHFWMKTPFDSYLGNIKDGGGALQEHSHGLHILILLLNELNIDLNNIDSKSNIVFKKGKNKKYDIFSNIFGYHNNIYFNYNTDLFTYPAEKRIKVEGEEKIFEWICNYQENLDIVKITNKKKIIKKTFKKTRSSEFENEIKHIINLKKKDYNKSNINLPNAIKVINVIKKVIEQNEK